MLPPKKEENASVMGNVDPTYSTTVENSISSSQLQTQETPLSLEAKSQSLSTQSQDVQLQQTGPTVPTETQVDIASAQSIVGGKSKKPKKEKSQGLELTLSSIDKKYGKGLLFKGSSGGLTEAEFIGSGSISLDTILGGGYGRGRLIELYGPNGCGKTTCSLHAIAECQRRGGTCAFLDMEHALDKRYAKALNVNMEELLISQPDYAEQALDVMDMLIRSGEINLIVLDSVAALVPKVELEGEMTDEQVGLQARLMSKFCRKDAGIAEKTGTTIIFINQLRSTISFGYGPKELSTGGNALKFYTSQRLEIKRIGAIKEKEEVVGNKTKIKVVKNKLASPYRETELCLTYGRGLNRSIELIDLGMKYNLVERSGAWYTIGEQRLQGTANASKFLDETPKVADKLEAAIREKIAENNGRL